MLGFVVAVAVALWATDRFTRVGLATRAAASNSRGAAALGWSPAALAAIGWMIGGGLSAIAGIMTAPLVGLDVSTFPLMIINVLAVALIGGFRSYPLTMLGAAVVGIAQAELAYYVDVTGIVWSLPFIIVVVLIAVRGKGLPDRGYFTERPPEVGIWARRPPDRPRGGRAAGRAHLHRLPGRPAGRPHDLARRGRRSCWASSSCSVTPASSRSSRWAWPAWLRS